MNDFGQTILVLAIQLSFPLLGGLLLSRRRSPGVACSVLTASIIAVCTLEDEEEEGAPRRKSRR